MYIEQGNKPQPITQKGKPQWLISSIALSRRPRRAPSSGTGPSGPSMPGTL
nr:MAG TPA: hypothetical protein [Caudoviricetes sp.]